MDILSIIKVKILVLVEWLHMPPSPSSGEVVKSIMDIIF